MSAQNDEMKKLERLGMLLDGESADPEGDLRWVESDADIARRYRDYRRIRDLANTLETPDTSAGFAGRVLARVAGPGETVIPRYRYALAAGALIMLGCLFLYLRFAGNSEIPSAPLMASEPPAAVNEDVPDADMAFMSSIAESAEFLDMSLSLASLEEIPGEELFSLVAEIASDEEALAGVLEEEGTATQALYLDDGTGEALSFAELFDFVEPLDAMEADVVNQALRAALEAA